MTFLVIMVAYVLAGLAFTHLKGIHSRRIEEQARWPHIIELAKRRGTSPLKTAKACRRITALTEIAIWPIFVLLLTFCIIERDDDEKNI